VKGLYLAIATIAASFIAHFLFANLQFTGGTGGLSVPPASLFGMLLDTSFRLYWLIVPVTVLMLLGAANLFRTRIGRAFIAIRDRDISAEVLGIPLLRYKLLSFGLSSFYAGVAGGLWAYFFPRGHARELSAAHVHLLPRRHHRRRHGQHPGAAFSARCS
jgi:branched-chain amino acid transport system permease protein